MSTRICSLSEFCLTLPKDDGGGTDNWSYTDIQTSSQIITTNKPTPTFTGRMPFLLPNQQCQSTEGKKYHTA